MRKNHTYQWNGPEKITLPGGSTSEYAYDPLMQVKTITMRDPGQNPFMVYNYQHSPAGNITAKSTEHGNYSYQYDELYHLKGATNPVLPSETYTYDAVGNRLTAEYSGQQSAESYTCNENNELLGYGDVSYQYDDNGNIISRTDQAGTTTYTYDAGNRLVQVITPDLKIINYYYDPFSRRLWKDINGVRTYFSYSDEGLIGEYNSNGSEIKTYGYAPNSIWTTNPLFQKIGINYYWYQNDHLGTPQKIIDTSGRIVWAAAYDSFGNAQIITADMTNNLRFPGQYYDAETGLYYNWNRYYNTEIGRYMSTDPLREGMNLYNYVFNNPVNLTDPHGTHVLKKIFYGIDALANDIVNPVAEPWADYIITVFYKKEGHMSLTGTYGNFCGGEYTGGKRYRGSTPEEAYDVDPVKDDPIDAACKQHDKDYNDAKGDPWKLIVADTKLINELESLDIYGSDWKSSYYQDDAEYARIRIIFVFKYLMRPLHAYQAISGI